MIVIIVQSTLKKLIYLEGIKDLGNSSINNNPLTCTGRTLTLLCTLVNYRSTFKFYLKLSTCLKTHHVQAKFKFLHRLLIFQISHKCGYLEIKFYKSYGKMG